MTATSKLSKKQKIIEIDLRSQKLGSPKRYHSQGGGPPQSSPFGTIEPQITTHICQIRKDLKQNNYTTRVFVPGPIH